MAPRPQTSCAKKTGIKHQTSRPQVRAKSAHPRLLQAAKYMHTNASTKQLQVGTDERGLETRVMLFNVSYYIASSVSE